MAARFRPRELREDATPEEIRRQLNDYFRDIAADFGAITARPRITEVQLGDYTARFGEIVRMAPPTAGARLILPAPNAAQPNGRVTLLLVGSSGAVTVEAVTSTVNGAATLALGAGEGLVEFTLAPDTDGWLAASSDVLLAPGASTSIVYDVTSHEYQRAALTGAVTAAQNSNATAFGAAAAKSVLVNATNGSAVPAFLAGTGAFQYLRLNSANTGLEWAVLSLASFPAQASDTFLGNVSGSSGVPSAVNLSSLAGTDLTFSAHALSVSSTWSSVLGRGANSGAHNPIIDASQWLGFGANPAGVSSGQLRADGAWTARSNGLATVNGDGGVALTSSGGDISLLTLFGDVKLAAVSGGRVTIPSGFVDYTGQSASTPSVASGHGIVWTKTDSPSRLYFTDDGNTDNKLAYVSDIPSDTGGGLGKFRKFSASTFSPVALYNFQNDVTDSSGNGLNLTAGSSFFRMLGMQTDGTPIYAVAESVNADLKRSSHDTSLAITGDMTVQIIVGYTSLGTATTIAEWVAFEGGDETQANNYLWAMIQSSGSPEAYWEHGAGVDVTYTPLTGNAGLRFANVAAAPVYWAWTRTSNVVQMYCDGKPWGAASGTLTAPDGGSTSTLRFFNKGGFGEFILCCKISASALSAADIASEYNATLGLMKGLV